MLFGYRCSFVAGALCSLVRGCLWVQLVFGYRWFWLQVLFGYRWSKVTCGLRLQMVFRYRCFLLQVVFCYRWSFVTGDLLLQMVFRYRWSFVTGVFCYRCSFVTGGLLLQIFFEYRWSLALVRIHTQNFVSYQLTLKRCINRELLVLWNFLRLICTNYSSFHS